MKLQLEDAQCGFRPTRSTPDLILIIRKISEKVIKHDQEVHLCCVDLEKTCDWISRRNELEIGGRGGNKLMRNLQ